MRHGALRIQEIVDGLGCRRLGARVECVDTTPSTNSLAWQRVDQGAPDGLVIVAEHQTVGRGRFGRTWESPRGASVLCSFVVRDEESRFTGGSLGLVCAIAACDAVRSATAVPAEIRWPNDLVVEERKIGGVLVESRPARSGSSGAGDHPAGRIFVAGIGINCLQHEAHFPLQLRGRVTSLDLQSPRPIDRTLVCRALLRELDGWLTQPGRCAPDSIRDAWLARAVGLGATIRLLHGGREYTGVVLDLDPTTALVIQSDHGGRMLFYAESATVLRE